MKYWYHPLNPQLKDYIRTIVVLAHSDPAEPNDLPLFTNGMPALLCKIENNNHQLSLFGHAVPEDQWSLEKGASMIAFFFNPFVISSVFNLPMQKIKKENITLNNWNAQKTIALHLQLIHAHTIEEKIDILDHFILTQAASNKRECGIIRYATDKMLEDPSPDILNQLLKDLNLTERTFQRIFKKYVGITANEYRRICQFQMAFFQLKSGEFDKLTDVAYSNGYFDQSHYIRSFKEFTETTPNEYLEFGLKK